MKIDFRWTGSNRSASLGQFRQQVGPSLGRGRRFVELLIQDVTLGGLDLRATSLVYTTLLSLAPLLAVSFSVLKAFGAHNQMRPFLLQLLEPLGEPAAEIADRIIGFVNNLEVGVLGFTGFALLFYTAVSLLQKIENSFNQIWQVDRPRDLRRRFSEYLSVLLVGPVLLFSAFGVMASLSSNAIVQSIIALEPFGTLYLYTAKLLPILFLIGTLTFLYLFIPNTKVKLRAALIGGIAAGLAWRLAGWLFGRFVAGSTEYAAIYSSFAILIVFMIWMYVNWLVLLIGVDISFYVQHPHYLRVSGHRPRPGCGLSRRVGLLIMYLLAERFHRGAPPWTLEQLTERLDLPEHLLRGIVENLRLRGLILAVEQPEPAYVPGRDPETIGIGEIIEVLEANPHGGYQDDVPALTEPAVDRLLAELRAADRAVTETRSLASLVGAAAAAPAAID